MCSVQRRELVSLDLAGEPNRRRSQLKGSAASRNAGSCRPHSVPVFVSIVSDYGEDRAIRKPRTFD
jgi:hypothetical protein